MHPRTLAFVLLCAAACGDNVAPTVRIESAGAAWAAVHVDGVWTRHDDLPVELSARGRYEVVVVCRADVGMGWSAIAYAEDRPALSRACFSPEPEPPADEVTVELDATGDVGRVLIGHEGTYDPGNTPIRLAPGVYDVVAERAIAIGTVGPPRVQLLRDVVIDGPRRIAIDVESGGVDLVTPDVRVGGEAPDDVRAVTTTARGTPFEPWAGLRAAILPPGAAAAGDRVDLTVAHDGGWAEVPYDGPLDLALPPEHTTAELRWSPLPAADITTEGDWDWIALRIGDRGIRRWAVFAQPEVVAAEGAVAVAAPPFEDRFPSWLPDPSVSSYGWSVEWSRDRAGGGREGRRIRGHVTF